MSAMMALPIRVGWGVIWRLGVLLASLIIGRVPDGGVGAALGILVAGGLAGAWAKVGLLPSLYRILGAVLLLYFASYYVPSRFLILAYTAALVVIVIDIWWTMSAPLFREAAKEELEPEVSQAAPGAGTLAIATPKHRSWMVAMTSLIWLAVALIGINTIARVWHVQVSFTEDTIVLVREVATRAQELASRLLSIMPSS